MSQQKILKILSYVVCVAGFAFFYLSVFDSRKIELWNFIIPEVFSIVLFLISVYIDKKSKGEPIKSIVYSLIALVLILPVIILIPFVFLLFGLMAI